MKAFAAFAIVTITLLGLALVLAQSPDDLDQPDDPTVTQLPDDSTTSVSPDDGKDTPVSLADLDKDGDQSSDDADGQTISAQGEALRFKIRKSHDLVPTGSFRDFYVQIDVEADEAMPETRAPLNVALVIDRSGSMRGEPMEQARRAARTFVDALDKRDRIALIAFDSRSTVEVPSVQVDESGRHRLHRAIDRLHAGGTTNISGGLEDGFNQVQSGTRPEMLNRVVLMTDGIPNVGITTHDGLVAKTGTIRRQGVSVSTMGFGTDYDSSLMAAMSTEGAGNFRHIRNAADLEVAFSEELGDLQSTVAAGLELDLQPGSGARIERVYGFSAERKGQGQHVAIGDLGAGERRSVVAHLRVDGDAQQDLRKVLDIKANYVDRLVDRPVGDEFAVDVAVSADHAAVAQSLNVDVMGRVEELRSQESIQEALEHYRRGDQRQAQQRLERERVRARRARQQYNIDEDSAPARRVDGVLDRLSNTVREHAPRSAGGRNAMAEEEVQAVEVFQGR